MKWKIAIAMLAVAGFLTTKGASALDYDQAQYQLIQYTIPPVQVMDTCNVNGVNYPVDYSYRIWATNAAGFWVVIGRINLTPAGPVAVGLGQTYPAFCQ